MTLPIWIDPRELDELEQRYPEVPRSDLATALERHWPVRAEVEAAVGLLREARRIAFGGTALH